MGITCKVMMVVDRGNRGESIQSNFIYSDILLHVNLFGFTGMLHLVCLHGLYPFDAIIINKFT